MDQTSAGGTRHYLFTVRREDPEQDSPRVRRFTGTGPTPQEAWTEASAREDTTLGPGTTVHALSCLDTLAARGAEELSALCHQEEHTPLGARLFGKRGQVLSSWTDRGPVAPRTAWAVCEYRSLTEGSDRVVTDLVRLSILWDFPALAVHGELVEVGGHRAASWPVEHLIAAPCHHEREPVIYPGHRAYRGWSMYRSLWLFSAEEGWDARAAGDSDEPTSDELLYHPAVLFHRCDDTREELLLHLMRSINPQAPARVPATWNGAWTFHLLLGYDPTDFMPVLPGPRPHAGTVVGTFPTIVEEQHLVDRPDLIDDGLALAYRVECLVSPITDFGYEQLQTWFTLMEMMHENNRAEALSRLMMMAELSFPEQIDEPQRLETLTDLRLANHNGQVYSTDEQGRVILTEHTRTGAVHWLLPKVDPQKVVRLGEAVRLGHALPALSTPVVANLHERAAKGADAAGRDENV